MKRTSLVLASVIALLGLLIPSANASVSHHRKAVVPATVPPPTAYYNICNTDINNMIYGCIQGNGYAHAATLVEGFETLFHYNATTLMFQEADTTLCLQYNSHSVNYPVRMYTCSDDEASQKWTTSAYGANQLENEQSGTCLEGSESDGFGIPLTMSPCSNQYLGQNWIMS